MPLLLMRELSRARCSTRAAAPASGGRSSTASERGVPWGISESAYAFTDRAGNYQYRAFGVPGPRPEARPRRRPRGRAVRHRAGRPDRSRCGGGEPRAADARQALDGRFGFYESHRLPAARPRPATPPTPISAPAPDIVRAFFAHHQGMSLVALTNVSATTSSSTRFHADPRVKATELLLQERVPREAILVGAAAGRERPRRRAVAGVLASQTVPIAAHLQPAHALPVERPLHRGLTHAGGGFSTWRGLSVTRRREDRTSDAGAHFIYLRDPWSGDVWSPTYQPIVPRAGRVRGHLRPRQGDLPAPRRRFRNAAAGRRVAGRRRRSAAAVDHQSRRSAARDRGHQLRGDRAGAPRRRPRASRRSASCSSRPSTTRRAPGCSSAGGRDRPTRPPPGPSTCSASTAGSAARSNGRPIARASSAAADRRPTRSRSTAARCRARPARCSIRSRRCASACGSRRARSCA